MPYLQRVHTDAETLAYFRDVVPLDHEVWVAVDGDRVFGFIAFDSGWVDHLYVHPDCQELGAGSALLEKAKTSASAGLQLRVFQRNTVARRFYEKRGFRLVSKTDGGANEENEPDALYEWNAARPSSEID
jgi:ribosomal protein S18 acetylase RimI-like enzyme